jgi:hypothetical protein
MQVKDVAATASALSSTPTTGINVAPLIDFSDEQ